MISKKNMISRIVRSVNEAVNRNNIELNAKILAVLRSGSLEDPANTTIFDRLGIRYEYFGRTQLGKTIQLTGPNGRTVKYERYVNVQAENGTSEVVTSRDLTNSHKDWSTGFMSSAPGQLDKIDFVTLLTRPDYIDHTPPTHRIDQPGDRFGAFDIGRYQETTPVRVHINDKLVKYADERDDFVVSFNRADADDQRAYIIDMAKRRSGLTIQPGRTPRIIKAK